MLKAKTRFKLSQRTSEPVRRLRKKRKDIIENHNSTKVARRLRRKAERSISASNSEDEKVIRGVFEWPLSSVEHCDYSSTCVAADDPACSMLTPSSDLNTCEAPPTLSYLHKPLCSVLHERVDREEAAGALWVRVLLGRLASERLPPTEESFGSELQDWMQCAGHLVGRGEIERQM